MQADYKLMSLMLSGNQVAHSPAELHGLLTGQLCSGAAPDAEDLGELMQQAQHLAPVVTKLVERLLADTREQLSDPEFHFQPLLPPDESELHERVEALGAWCDGFTVGFAAGFIKPESALTGEAREILSDFGQFAAISENDEDFSEQDEADYMELVEYVRMATITLFQLLAASQVNAPHPHLTRPPSDSGIMH